MGVAEVGWPRVLRGVGHPTDQTIGVDRVREVLEVLEGVVEGRGAGRYLTEEGGAREGEPVWGAVKGDRWDVGHGGL